MTMVDSLLCYLLVLLPVKTVSLLQFFFFPNHLHTCFNTMYTFSKLFTQWALQTHTSAYQLTFGEKWNFNKCSLLGRLLCHSKYNDLKNTDNLKHCKMHILCVAVSSIFAQFSVALQKKRNMYDTLYT